MRKINLIPSSITAFSLACGLFVILKVNMIEPGGGTYHALQSAVLLLLLAAVADVLDGAVARALHAESEFGVMFDSLADAISFGVAPSVLVLKSLDLEQGTWLSFAAVAGAMLFSLGGVLRLVRFNVKAHEAEHNLELARAQKKHFTGLPIPAAALAAVSANLFLASPFAPEILKMGHTPRAVTLSAVMLLLGYLMVSRWKFPSLKALHFRVPSFHLMLFSALMALFFLYGILYFFPLVLLVATWGYIALAWTLAIIRLIAGKKSRTLEDFEPDDEI